MTPRYMAGGTSLATRRRSAWIGRVASALQGVAVLGGVAAAVIAGLSVGLGDGYALAQAVAWVAFGAGLLAVTARLVEGRP